MFVSQERVVTRKPFQKPNILRRKSKAVRQNAQKNDEAADIVSLLATSSSKQPTTTSNIIEQPVEDFTHSFEIVQAPKFCVNGNGELWDVNQVDASQTLHIDGDSITIYAHNTEVDNNNDVQSTLNVESFLNDGEIDQNNLLTNIDGTLSSRIVETDSKQKWCLDFMSEDAKDNFYNQLFTADIGTADDGSQIINICADKNLDTSTEAEVLNQTHEYTNKSEQDVTLNTSNNTGAHMGAIKFKCDVPNCNKEFWTEARFQKHKNSHNKEKSKPTILDCPVKKTDADGVETKCGRTFLVRNQLMKHLNEDHTAEDALFRCTFCGRRFFWAGGVRAHQAGACARAFPCGWAGCGRVFRHPCRLREHARAHTGDRPYPCPYPNCGWAFRSASKLVRHARRHTGERRHACSACGRAFPRREHLRDHQARHHAPKDATHSCTHPGCEETFPSVNSLYVHVKKVHKKKDSKPSASKKTPKRAKKDMFVVSLLDPQALKLDAQAQPPAPVSAEESEPVAELVEAVAEGRSARTHCTWPLAREQPAEFALDHDAQVEQSESSDIYTVRSDLFLHGNVLINEDSEFIISRATEGEEGGARGAAAPLDSLGLIDSHPTIDLMQEELMYADAVDESSFRVFLLNGEELA